MESDRRILNLLRVGLDSTLSQKIVTIGYNLNQLRRANKSELSAHFNSEELKHILAAVKRKPIPRRTLQTLIEECDWKCCICWNFQEETPVVIHHIEEHSLTQDDSYDNLVLLCLNHHALAHSKWEISRHPLPPELIRYRKQEWVEAVKKYKAETQPENGGEEQSRHIEFAPRINTGKELVGILRGAALYNFESEGVNSEDDAQLVGGFLRRLQDLGDVLEFLDAGDIVETEFQLNSELKELEENNFAVFGKQELRKFRSGGKIAKWPLAIVRVVHWVMTPELEKAAAKWDEIASKYRRAKHLEERDELFGQLVELMLKYRIPGGDKYLE